MFFVLASASDSPSCPLEWIMAAASHLHCGFVIMENRIEGTFDSMVGYTKVFKPHSQGTTSVPRRRRCSVEHVRRTRGWLCRSQCLWPWLHVGRQSSMPVGGFAAELAPQNPVPITEAWAPLDAGLLSRGIVDFCSHVEIIGSVQGSEKGQWHCVRGTEPSWR